MNSNKYSGKHGTAAVDDRLAVARRRLAIYLAFTFVLSWGIWIPAGLALGTFEHGEASSPAMMALIAAGMFLPLVGALVANRVCGQQGSIDLCLRPNIKGNVRLYLAAWFLPALITLLGDALFFALNPQLFDPTFSGYLQTMVDLPWGVTTHDNLNLKNAQRVLDHDHYGLKNVKERILEHLAVLKMRGDMKSPILCLVGPPGVGKTSLGKSIATALKREYVRISLGGLHDEAEIRGHRRTYIGALPGRIISGIQKAKTDNPVFVLDEIDKISSDFKGDPSSALLEVLDPEQNKAFHDNFLDVDYDLSKVLFIATANSLTPIAAPLLDRMEVIELSGYILEEKIEIGERHLLPKQKEEHGLADIKFNIPRRTMEKIVDQYTRESGVRLLDKALAKVMRKVAWRVANEMPVPEKLQPTDLIDFLGKPDYNPEKYDGNDYAGVVTGLAWTSVGGCILEVESTLVPGKKDLSLTGHLGDVMKESAQLALQWVKANSLDLGIDPAIFENWTAHIHCPEGAVPKDGPSAGITMVTSLVSTLTQRRVRARVAMTGEITLRGKVIPIGGVKEKILAAKRAGITDVVLCVDNRKDVEDIEKQYTEGLNFHYVRDLHEVLDFALLKEKVKHPKKFI